MSWTAQLQGDPLPWLLDKGSPGVRYLALRNVMGLEEADSELKRARRLAHREGEIAQVLDHMQAEGYWVKSGPGYLPKYQSTVWSLILLAQLGADAREDKRITQACHYLLDHALAACGQITASDSGSPSGTADCLQGNMVWSLAELGYEDPRLEKAHEWMARSLTGEGVTPVSSAGGLRAVKPLRQGKTTALETVPLLRYYASGKYGPDFACAANNKLSCAWGGVKVMLGFAKLTTAQRTPLIRRAIKRGVDFLFSVDPATAAYPAGYSDKPSSNWWKFGFPVFYVTDLLQLAEALTELGYGNDPRLAGVLEIIRAKQDAQGRWPLEYDYTGKTWLDFGVKKQPNKWVTLRALEVLRGAS